MFTLRRVNSPHAALCHLWCYNVRKLPKGVEEKGLFTREASTGGNLHECLAVFSWLRNKDRQWQEGTDGTTFSTIEDRGKWGKCRISFYVFLLLAYCGRENNESGIQMSVLLQVCPSPSPAVPLRNVACRRPSREVRKCVVRGVVQSYWNETQYVSFQWDRMIISISINTNKSPWHCGLCVIY